MLLRLTAIVLLAGCVLAGCGEPNAQVSGNRVALADRGSGVYLFGPTPLPVGQEQLGYFAHVKPTEPQLMMFDYHQVFVRTRIWDVEDNRQPDVSYDRRRTFSDEVRFRRR